ncbi:MAG: hypothetical protein KatS3mg027_0565 [Bacteroidia bacterium]|nr:MAG: hypothetical protein KatS3mg027_0565 [Bacteroidia bacterium]
MRSAILLFLLLTLNVSSQEIAYYKQKFDKYLNLHHQLDSIVFFYQDKIVIKNNNKQEELTIYKDEIPTISKFLESEKLEVIEKFFLEKKNRQLTKREKDSILISIDEVYSFNKKNHLPLSGIRIAIDPGHFGYNYSTAKVEQRLLYFPNTHLNSKNDSAILYEGQLTYLTSKVLANKLEEQGAEILLTRNDVRHTAFGISFEEWMAKRKQKVLDSLFNKKELSYDKYVKLKKASPQQFFNLFFREYELLQRSKIINNFNPHLTIIIHYNVDEKNSPWKKPTTNNYSMCFIGGAFENNDLDKLVNKIHFLRLLLTQQIENSEKISSFTIQNFENQLSVNAAKTKDAKYLQTVCVPTNNEGVYCRNLLLTRHVISPLVYGESMCQDNILEYQKLTQYDYSYKNFKIPKRVYEVADAYFKSTMQYFNEIFFPNFTSQKK